VPRLASAKGQNAVCAARRHATEYLEIETDNAHREEIFTKLLAEEAELRKLPEKYRARIREQDKLMVLLQKAHTEHDAHAVR
jgi:tellurite resistance protein TerC